MKNHPVSPEDDVGELAQRLQRALIAAQAKNQQLQSDIVAAEVRRQEAEARAIQAEEQASESSKRLEILENLRNERYQKVITELFQRPSRQAAGLTLVVAVVSILIGKFLSDRQAKQTSKRNSQAITQVARSLRDQVASSVSTSIDRTREEIQRSEKRTKDDLGALIRVMTDPDLRDGGLTDLQANSPIQATVGQSASRYFRLILSRELPMSISLTPIAGDPNLFVAFERIPRPNGSFDGRSELNGTVQELLSWTNAPAGQWFVRVSSVAGASFKIEASWKE